MKKKLLSVILAAAMVTAMLAGCGSKEAEAPAAAEGETETEAPAQAEGETEAPAESAGGEGGLVGVAMPTKDLQRWNQG